MGKKIINTDSYHMHEALDRTSIILAMWDENVASHPAILKNKKWHKQADKVSELIYQLYASIGEKHL